MIDDPNALSVKMGLRALPRSFGQDTRNRWVLPTPLSDPMVQMLRDKRSCLLVGAPRSGKTTAACYAAHRYAEKYAQPRSPARYLDLSLIGDARLDVPQSLSVSLRTRSPIVIDNWHARPDATAEVLRALGAARERPAVLIVATTVEDEPVGPDVEDEPSGSEGVAHIVADFRRALQLEGNFLLRSEGATEELAWRMYQRVLELNGCRPDDPGYSPLHVDFPDAHMRLQGNLRLLHHRLDAWNPAQEMLADVDAARIVRNLRRDYARRLCSTPTTAGAIWPSIPEPVSIIAALSQLEVPRRVVDDELDAELARYAGSGVFVDFDGQWLMDPTDAYLLLHVPDRAEWAERVAKRLAAGLAQSPRQLPGVLLAVCRSVRPEVRGTLLCALVDQGGFGERFTNWVAKTLGDNPKSATRVLTVMAGLFAQFATAEAAERSRRARHVAEALTPVTRSLADATAMMNAQRLHWFMRDLVRGGPQLADFRRDWLGQVPDAVLVRKIDALPHGDTQRRMLRWISSVDPDRERVLRPSVQFKKRKESAAAYYGGMNLGLVSTAQKRAEVLERIRRFDQESICALLESDKRPFRRIAQVLRVAYWLDTEQAARVSRHLVDAADLMEHAKSFDCVHRVLALCREIDAAAGKAVASTIAGMPIGTVLTKLPPDEIGVTVQRLEAASHGCSGAWASELPSTVGTTPALPPLKDLGLRKLLLCGVAYDSAFLRAALSWPSRPDMEPLAVTALEALGVPDLPRVGRDERAVARMDDIEADYGLLRMYGLLHGNGTGASSERERACELVGQLPAEALVTIARGALRSPQAVREALHALHSRFPPRLSLLRQVVAAFWLGKSLQWPNRQFSATDQRAVALFCALNNRIIRWEPVEAGDRYEGRPNERNDFTRRTIAELQRLTKALNGKALSLQQWDQEIGQELSIDDADILRRVLLECDALEPVAAVVGNDLSLAFRNKRASRMACETAAGLGQLIQPDEADGPN